MTWLSGVWRSVLSVSNVSIKSFHKTETIPTTRHAEHPGSGLRRGCSFSTGADEEQVHQLEQEATPTTQKNARKTQEGLHSSHSQSHN